MTKGLISVIIPSRNEIYLHKTIQDLFNKATQDIEIVAICDGYWPKPQEIITDKRLRYLHFTNPQGMRGAINAGVAIAKGEYILKSDAHCMFAPGFDEELKKNCEYDWVVVPRRMSLDPDKWELINNPKYPIDYMYLGTDLRGQVWTGKNNDLTSKTKMIDDLMTFQGSCWFMKRSYFDWLELLDEKIYGTFWQEAQEIGLKTWLSGGKVKRNKYTWYAHWHKPSDVGRGYSLAGSNKDQCAEMMNKWINGKVWRKQKHDISYLINKFKPVPGWQ